MSIKQAIEKANKKYEESLPKLGKANVINNIRLTEEMKWKKITNKKNF